MAFARLFPIDATDAHDVVPTFKSLASTQRRGGASGTPSHRIRTLADGGCQWQRYPANLRLEPIYRGDDLDAFRAMAKILSLNRFPVSHPPEIRCQVRDGFFGTP